jgi:hypothetical protein
MGRHAAAVREAGGSTDPRSCECGQQLKKELANKQMSCGWAGSSWTRCGGLWGS